MPQTSASRRSRRRASVYDFLLALARKRLGPRLGGRGALSVFEGTDGVLTLVHERCDADGGEAVAQRIAQLRPDNGGYRLFWKRGNGRWTAYTSGDDLPFVGSIAACLAEISRDPCGCYWS
jgi:hypothetical protein